VAKGIRIKMTPGKLKRAVRAAVPESALRCAIIVEGDAKALMRIGGGIAHTPSKEPKPPHVQTGTLRASIRSAKTATGAVVGPTESYGAVHEFGGRHHPKRPFMRPALDKAKPRFAKQFKNMVKTSGASK